MVAPTAGLLKRPVQPDFVGPLVVLQLVRMLEKILGADACDLALKEARLYRLPKVNEPVREEKAARLHSTVRRLWPDKSDDILRRAGSDSGSYILEHQLSKRARTLLNGMPKSAAAWMLAKSAEQQSWLFTGSGTFRVESSSLFVLERNPLILGERSDKTLCHFHSALFETLFRAMVHPQLECREVTCLARGDDACTFRFDTPAA
jgi:divinyl protochlorophyllide a 8-vinyl-reductase